MIVDRLENAHLYAGLSEKIEKAFEILNDKSLAEKEDGRYEVHGDNLFYIVQRYQTKTIDKAGFEAHRKYIDIQVLLQGRETIGYAPTDELTVNIPYKEDVLFYETPENYTEIKLSKGMFAIFYPSDAHMPSCQLDGPSSVHKVVVKVKV